MTNPWRTGTMLAHARNLDRSLRHWTGSGLPVDFSGDDTEFARRVFQGAFVLVSHGTETDPVLNYGNGAALGLWEMTWEQLTSTPSRLTAEAPDREERARLLDAVTRRGFIDDYTGVRISSTGRRFYIRQATVWNLIEADGTPCGQAAMFHHWEFLA